MVYAGESDPDTFARHVGSIDITLLDQKNVLNREKDCYKRLPYYEQKLNICITDHFITMAARNNKQREVWYHK